MRRIEPEALQHIAALQRRIFLRFASAVLHIMRQHDTTRDDLQHTNDVPRSVYECEALLINPKPVASNIVHPLVSLLRPGRPAGGRARGRVDRMGI